MKKLSRLLFIPILFASFFLVPVSFGGHIQKAEAVFDLGDLSKTFGADSSYANPFLPAVKVIPPVNIAQTEVSLSLQINKSPGLNFASGSEELPTEARDSNNNPLGYIKDFDPLASQPSLPLSNINDRFFLGFWYSVLDRNFCINNGNCGIYLDIGTQVGNGSSSIDVNNGNLYAGDLSTIAQDQYITGNVQRIPLYPYLLNMRRPDGSADSPSATNKQRILDSSGVFIDNLIVSNLTPGTRYYARIRMEENVSGDRGTSKIIVFDTPPATPVNAGDPVAPVDLSQTSLISQASNADEQDIGDVIFDDMLDCGWTNLTGCAITILYKVIYVPSTYLVRIAGWLLDIFIALTLSPEVYKNVFVQNGWEFLRDLCNIGFIGILIYIAVSTMVGTGNEWKTQLPKIIIAAILINFSFFMTRVVIDGGNILSLVFYNQISITNQTDSLIDQSLSGYVPERNISKGIIAGTSLQKMLSADNVEPFKKAAGNSGSALIVILGIILNIVIAWSFFIVAWTMLGRIVELWLSIIGSPVAFISNAVPMINSKAGRFGWSKWWENLISVAFMPAIFLFFVILIIKLADIDIGGLQNTTSQATDFTSIIVSIVLRFIIIIALLNMAKTQAIKASGEVGEMIVGVGKMVGTAAIGLAGGAVIGAGAKVGQFAASKVAERVGKSETLNKFKDEKGIRGWAARQTLKGNDTLKTKTFDLRNSAAAASAMGALANNKMFGLDDMKSVNLNNKAVTGLGFDTKSTEGGWTGMKKREKETLDKELKAKQLSGDKAAAQQDRSEQYDEDRKEAKKVYETAKGPDTWTDDKAAEFEKQYKEGKENIEIDGVALEGSGSKGDVRTVKEINKEITEKHMEFVKEGGTGFLAAASQSTAKYANAASQALGGTGNVTTGNVDAAAGVGAGAAATGTGAVVAGMAGAAAGGIVAGGFGAGLANKNEARKEFIEEQERKQKAEDRKEKKTFAKIDEKVAGLDKEAAKLQTAEAKLTEALEKLAGKFDDTGAKIEKGKLDKLTDKLESYKTAPDEDDDVAIARKKKEHRDTISNLETEVKAKELELTNSLKDLPAGATDLERAIQKEKQDRIKGELTKHKKDLRDEQDSLHEVENLIKNIRDTEKDMRDLEGKKSQNKDRQDKVKKEKADQLDKKKDKKPGGGSTPPPTTP